MINVAVAGGTGGVGRTIVEVLATSPHNAFILSRKAVKHMITVDYSDIDALVETLESNAIDTVISAFSVNCDSPSKSQANLIEASKRSEPTKRFIPSSFAIPYPVEALEVLPQLKDYFAAIETLKASHLEFTLLYSGIFLDYFGGPQLKSYLKPNVFVVDLVNKVATIPGDGNTPVAFTYTFDLAKFIFASLELEQWPEESKVVCDSLTWNEFVSLAEKTLGTKLETHFDPVEKLKRFEITELPGHQALYKEFPKQAFQRFMSIFGLFTADGISNISREGGLNQGFPEIKVLTVRGLLERHWKGI
ncbi:hypothetical protein BDV06DRAFT_215518 [Aspergillus oleicola]